jgi:hypothetical protein
MATARRQPYRQYRQRTLITGIAAASSWSSSSSWRTTPSTNFWSPRSDSATAAPTP